MEAARHFAPCSGAIKGHTSLEEAAAEKRLFFAGG